MPAPAAPAAPADAPEAREDEAFDLLEGALERESVPSDAPAAGPRPGPFWVARWVALTAGPGAGRVARRVFASRERKRAGAAPLAALELACVAHVARVDVSGAGRRVRADDRRGKTGSARSRRSRSTRGSTRRAAAAFDRDVCGGARDGFCAEAAPSARALARA